MSDRRHRRSEHKKRRDKRYGKGRHWYCANQGCGNKMFANAGVNPNHGGWNCWKCGGRTWR